LIKDSKVKIDYDDNQSKDSLIRSFTIDDEEDEKKIDENNFKILKNNPELCTLVKSLLHRS